MSLNLPKKIIFTGPPNSGKTTIIKVFFEKINPINILNISNPVLEPTRGAEINVYNLFNSEIGIFDLAGQENKDWYGEGKDIFNDSDMILLIFDVTTELKDIIRDIVSINDIIQHVCKDAILYVILHKIDLKPKLYLIQKLSYIKKWLEDKYPSLKKFEIITTSIKEDYFIESYIKIQNIMIDMIRNNIIEISYNDYKKFDLCIRVLLNLKMGVRYYLSELFKKSRILDKHQVDVISILQYLDLIKLYQNIQSDTEQLGIQIEMTEKANQIMSQLYITNEKENNKGKKIHSLDNSIDISLFDNYDNIFKDEHENSIYIKNNDTISLFYLFNQIQNKNLKKNN